MFIAFTAITPADHRFAGKKIAADGTIREYDKGYLWHPRLLYADSIVSLYPQLVQVQQDGGCVIRGVSASNVDPIPRQRAHRNDKRGRPRGDRGFNDDPVHGVVHDFDGAILPDGYDWRADPAAAVDSVVSQLPEPWCSTSYIWMFSGTHGLARDHNDGRWNGEFESNTIKVHVIFLADRGLRERELISWLDLLAALDSSMKIDSSVARCVQPIYMARPLWECGGEVLGDIAVHGLIRKQHDLLTVPDDLAEMVAVARAHGLGKTVADHPSAEAAIRAIGLPKGKQGLGRSEIRVHLMATVKHLTAPDPDVDPDAIVKKVQELIKTNEDAIADNLLHHGRTWGEVWGYFPSNVRDMAPWWSIRHKEDRAKYGPRYSKRGNQQQHNNDPLDMVRARIAAEINDWKGVIATYNEGEIIGWWPPYPAPPLPDWVTEADRGRGLSNLVEDNAEVPIPVKLLRGATGSGKSHAARKLAAMLLASIAEGAIVIAVPRHALGEEQVRMFMEEHPGIKAAIWRGRDADDPRMEHRAKDDPKKKCAGVEQK
jgi:hypothetical protein